MGTGAIFGFVAARETWFSPLRPLEFLSAALTSGLALLILVVVLTLKFSGRVLNKNTVISLGRLLSMLIVPLFILIFLDKLTHLYAPDREATLFILTGHFSWIFWVFQIGMGIVIPLLILSNSRLNKKVLSISLAAVSVVVGVFFERYYLVIPGAAYPMPLYPGEIQGIWGAVSSFSITPVEMIFSLGVLAMLVLLFVLGLKYLELLPAGESSEATKT
jgi:molybdopterin-containing oxidoreductase family membrane subunit